MFNMSITDRALCLWGPGRKNEQQKKRKKQWKILVWILQPSEKVRDFIFPAYVFSYSILCKKYYTLFLGLKNNNWFCCWTALQTSISDWWQSQKTEHVQANIPTLPSGGSLPLGVFALMAGVRQLGASVQAGCPPRRRSLQIFYSFIFLCTSLYHTI